MKYAYGILALLGATCPLWAAETIDAETRRRAMVLRLAVMAAVLAVFLTAVAIMTVIRIMRRRLGRDQGRSEKTEYIDAWSRWHLDEEDWRDFPMQDDDSDHTDTNGQRP